jgi:hypothetical protein
VIKEIVRPSLADLQLAAKSPRERKLMQEILSRPGYEKIARSEREFYELCVEESGDRGRPGFVVKQARAIWNESDKLFSWERPEWERLPTLKEAKERYEARREALRAKGFTDSDMEM